RWTASSLRETARTAAPRSSRCRAVTWNGCSSERRHPSVAYGMTLHGPGTGGHGCSSGDSPAARPRIIALVGPTAVGKTELGIEVALRFDAEIINADSQQVYRRLDVGSAKPTAVQRARVAHHVVDVVEPDQPFDCAQFRRLAHAAISDIAARGKRVLVV